MWDWVAGMLGTTAVGAVSYQAKKNSEVDVRLTALETAARIRHEEVKEDLTDIKDTLKGLVNFTIRGSMK